MLQPKSYPEMIGKALVLEAEPFITMVDDDNPWAEGLFMVALIGVLVGAAQLVGGWLFAASVPPLQAVVEALLQAVRQLNLGTLMGGDPAVAELSLRQSLTTALGWAGYGVGWTRFLALLLIPLSLVLQWLFVGLIGHGVALAQGGKGTLNETLGASALLVAPQVLRLLGVIPFVTVSNLLLLAWTVLITYRALEVAHELPWQRAALAAIAAPAALLLLTIALAGAASILMMVGGAA